MYGTPDRPRPLLHIYGCYTNLKATPLLSIYGCHTKPRLPPIYACKRQTMPLLPIYGVVLRKATPPFPPVLPQATALCPYMGIHHVPSSFIYNTLQATPLLPIYGHHTKPSHTPTCPYMVRQSQATPPSHVCLFSVEATPPLTHIWASQKTNSRLLPHTWKSDLRPHPNAHIWRYNRPSHTPFPKPRPFAHIWLQETKPYPLRQPDPAHFPIYGDPKGRGQADPAPFCPYMVRLTAGGGACRLCRRRGRSLGSIGSAPSRSASAAAPQSPNLGGKRAELGKNGPKKGWGRRWSRMGQYLVSFGGSLGSSGSPFGGIWGHTGAIWGHLGLLGGIWGHFGVILVHSGPLTVI